ncbi:hypothetical protein AALO_G00153900 [Alosa alosa]|uniref:Uncharacterized protein n=1 Tax=Alosa alosa TaxID=278164 RepID=A0AAV6GES7_9TELE|nr:hypothetical protein AALO_G00153900 [Alosa alosa]
MIKCCFYRSSRNDKETCLPDKRFCARTQTPGAESEGREEYSGNSNTPHSDAHSATSCNDLSSGDVGSLLGHSTPVPCPPFHTNRGSQGSVGRWQSTGMTYIRPVLWSVCE